MLIGLALLKKHDGFSFGKTAHILCQVQIESLQALSVRAFRNLKYTLNGLESWFELPKN